MKTHCKVLFVAMAFAATAFSGSMAGLTVNNGTASGNETGTLVTVTAAAAPVGTDFVGWSGDVEILANPSSPTTTATIPSMAVTITATYTAPATNSLPTPAPAPATAPAGKSVPQFGRMWEG
jgi:Divergent InlB B-repeat domain